MRHMCRIWSKPFKMDAQKRPILNLWTFQTSRLTLNPKMEIIMNYKNQIEFIAFVKTFIGAHTYLRDVRW